MTSYKFLAHFIILVLDCLLQMNKSFVKAVHNQQYA